jgi:transposase
MKIILIEEQKLSLEEQHKSENNGRIRDRIKAVLLASEGWTQKQIAQALRIHETTVWGHLNDYLYDQRLKPVGGGSKSKLDEVQTKELILYLEQNTYPSTKEIIRHVLLTYGVSYTQQGMHDWLSKNRFSYKKPKGTPAKFNTTRQEEFIKKYEALKVGLNPDELILFMDSVHPTQETKISYGWIRKGVEKLIATVASRKRVNLTGAIDLKTMSLVTRDYETIDGSATVDFLKAIEAAYPLSSKIHIIADGGSAHTSNEVALFLSQPNAVNRLYLEKTYGLVLPSNAAVLTKKIIAKVSLIMAKEPLLFEDKLILVANKLTAQQLLNTLKHPPPHPRLVMHILPPYSPNLNPSERLWKVMNEQIRDNKVYNTFVEFKTAVLTFFSNTWDTISSDFRCRINDNFQHLKPVVSI